MPQAADARELVRAVNEMKLAKEYLEAEFMQQVRGSLEARCLPSESNWQLGSYLNCDAEVFENNVWGTRVCR